MKTVSSVFNNRLYEGRKLESCATVQYILHERKTVLSVEDTEIDSPYNTYKYKGLPIGPISSPGLAANQGRRFIPLTQTICTLWQTPAVQRTTSHRPMRSTTKK